MKAASSDNKKAIIAAISCGLSLQPWVGHRCVVLFLCRCGPTELYRRKRPARESRRHLARICWAAEPRASSCPAAGHIHCLPVFFRSMRSSAAVKSDQGESDDTDRY
jgi:hypothetical protein